MACGRVVAGESYWCEVGTYRNGYGAEYLFTCFGYPNRVGPATQLHTLDRTRYIVNTAEGPMVYLSLRRRAVTDSSGTWVAYVWDWVLNAWVALREETIPELTAGDVRAQFELIPLAAGIEWPGLPRIDWVDLMRCGVDGWYFWTPTTVPNSTFAVEPPNQPYDYGIINNYCRWYAGGNNPVGTDPEGRDMRDIDHKKPRVTKLPEKIKIVKTELILGPTGMIPRPISPLDKEIEIYNPLE